jgi:LPS-assembly lipoprotein
LQPSGRPRRPFFIAFALAAILALSGCTATPLYGGGAAPAGVRADLAAIRVLPAADRVGQLVRNELVFAFTGGGLPATPLYELSLSVTASGGDPNLGAAAELSGGVIVTVRYTLVEIAGGATIDGGTLSVATRYTRSNSAFANVRAEQDAEQRAAIEAARQVALDIAAALAARRPA